MSNTTTSIITVIAYLAGYVVGGTIAAYAGWAIGNSFGRRP